MDQIKFRFVVREYDSAHFVNGKKFTERAIGIGLLDIQEKTIFPSPLSNFIRTFYGRRKNSLSSQRNAAYEVTKFINFLIQKISENSSDFIPLKEKGIFGLNLIHGSAYITHLSLRAREKEISPSYVYRIEKYLIKFFYWLKESQIIEPYFSESTYSPFDNLELGTIYPGTDERVSNKLVDFGVNRYDLVIKFINISKVIAPEITLGICFQFFGGLRAGEVVNLSKDAIETPYFWDENIKEIDRFILKIRDRHQHLFPNKKNIQHEQVKRPRNQSLLINNILTTSFINHKNLLKRIENSNKQKLNNALFLSPRTGDSITGKNYKDKFNKVKTAFLLQLSREENISDYLFLSDKSWSTHICRGVFTNFLLEIGASIPEVAIARGDKNINSVLAYVEEKNALSIAAKAINEIRKTYDNEIKDCFDKKEANIDSTIQKKFNTGVNNE